MKILHTADLHLGMKINKLPKEKSSLFRDEINYQINKLFKEAAEEYDIILICGDLFHSKQVPVKVAENFFEAVKEYARPVIYIVGNHDEKYILNENIPNNFIILNSSNNSYHYKGVNIFTAGKIENLKKSETNILMLHGNIFASIDADYLDINQYVNYDFDYIALGHLHEQKQLKLGNTVMAYSGSLFSNGFDECGDKGYLSVEFNNNQFVSSKFVPFASRRFMICDCDISALNNNHEIIEEIKNQLKAKGVSKKDIVRLILRGKVSEETSLSEMFIKEAFDDFFYFEIEDKTSFEIDFEKIKNEKLSFKYEFIRLVEESELSVEQKNIICRLGIEALKGEDFSL